MIARIGITGLVVAIAVSVCSLMPLDAAAAEKGVAVRFGGSASPFGEAFVGFENTRYHAHFGTAGHFLYRVTGDILGDDSFWGFRMGFYHLVNDVGQGGSTIGILAQYPIMLSGEIGKELWGFPTMLRAGAGVNITSFGNGTLIFDYEDDNLISIAIDTKTSVAYLVGFGIEYKLSKLTSVALDTDLILGNVETDWKIFGQSASDDFPFQDAELHVRHFAIMLGVNILLSSGDSE